MPKQQAGESLATIVWIYHQAGNQYHTRMMLEFDDAAQICFGASAKNSDLASYIALQLRASGGKPRTLISLASTA